MSFFGFVLAEPVDAFVNLSLVDTSYKPGLAPAGDLLFFASPKKPKEKKGDPMVWVPSLRYGQPAVLAENGVELELASLRQSLALIRFRLRSSAQPDGWGERIRKRKRTRGDRKRAARPVGPSGPSCLHARAAHAAK